MDICLGVVLFSDLASLHTGGGAVAGAGGVPSGRRRRPGDLLPYPADRVQRPACLEEQSLPLEQGVKSQL